MFFLIKCVVAILVVCFALDWRIGGDSPQHRDSPSARAASTKKIADAVGRASANGSALIKSGAEAVEQAARDKCLSAPAECLTLARRLERSR